MDTNQTPDQEQPKLEDAWDSVEEALPMPEEPKERVADEVTVEEAPVPAAPKTVTIDSDPFGKDFSTQHRRQDVPIAVPMTSATRDELIQASSDMVKHLVETVGEKEARKRMGEFNQRLGSAYRGHWQESEYESLFAQDQDWGQSVDSERGPIRIAPQKVNAAAGPLTGRAALLTVQSALGLGRPNRIPCWHSGLILAVSGFKESEFLDLVMSVTEARIDIGYDTNGLLFSGNDVNIVSEIARFVLRHVTACNIRGWLPGDTETLAQNLKVMDIPALLAGALAAIYPSGYPTVHRCKNSGTPKCDYSSEMKLDVDGIEFHMDSMLDFKKCLFVARKRISQSARRFMSAAWGTHTLEQIAQYQEEFNTLEPITGPMSDSGASIRLALRQPNLVTFEDAGRFWVNSVVDIVNAVMDKVRDGDANTRERRRADMFRTAKQRLDLQKYAAWIANIQIQVEGQDEASLIEELESIFDALETIADDRPMKKRIIAAVDDYRVRSQVSFTGIPNWSCPSCGEPQRDPADAPNGLIPMDMVSYFFIIMGSRQAAEGTI